MSEKYYTVGEIVNTHGIRGELKIVPKTDFPDVRFERGSVLHIVPPQGSSPVTEVKVERARPQKNVYIIKLEGFDSINDVEKWKGASLKISDSQLLELPSDEYYYHEISGCRVVTEDHVELGTVTEILAPGANDVWVVTPDPGKGKPFMLPVIDEVILNVDIQQKKITVHLLEGLLE